MIDRGFRPFLSATYVVDFEHPDVYELAQHLSLGKSSEIDIVHACFSWVRDEVLHTVDHGLEVITCAASDVLKARTGFCYAKSHLLAALLRANNIPAGFVYQRLATDETGLSFCLHGLNAVWLADYGWYRIDARGKRPGLRAEFEPPKEVLPFACAAPGERLLPSIYAAPLDVVVAALQQHTSAAALAANLPDCMTSESDTAI